MRCPPLRRSTAVTESVRQKIESFVRRSHARNSRHPASKTCLLSGQLPPFAVSALRTANRRALTASPLLLQVSNSRDNNALLDRESACIKNHPPLRVQENDTPH